MELINNNDNNTDETAIIKQEIEIHKLIIKQQTDNSSISVPSTNRTFHQKIHQYLSSSNQSNNTIMPPPQLRSFYGIPLIPLPPDVSRILFVSNLDTSMTGDMLYKIFGSIGPIRQIRTSDTAETANTAFIIFEDVFDAKTAQEKFNGFAVPTKSKNPKAAKNKPLQVRFFNQKSYQLAAERKKKRKDQLEELGRRQREMAEKSNNDKDDGDQMMAPENTANVSL